MDTHEQTKWLAEFYGEAHRTGRKIQKHIINNRWEDDDVGRGPGLHSDPKFWRLRPEPDKAWVVWFDGLPPHLCQTLKSAQNWNKFECNDNGTIQEIERPEK